MRDHRPPPFGTLRSVLPIQQAQKRGPWRLTLVSLEIWDNCWAANLDLDRDPFGSGEDYVSPVVTLDAFGEGARRYVSGFGGGHGGGRLDGGQQHRQLVSFAPAIDPASESVRLEARLQLRRSGPGSRSLSLDDSPDWEDPEPWVFSVPRSGLDGHTPPADLSPPARRPRVSPPPGCPPETGDLVRVVPIVAERTVGDWTITLVAAEVRTGGVLLVYRLLGPTPPRGFSGLAGPSLSATGDHGQAIPSWPGGGSGIRDPRGWHWRGDYHAAVPPGTHDLRIRVDEVHLEKIEEDPDNPGMARPVVAERIPFGWEISIPLR